MSGPRRYFSGEEDAILRRLYPRGSQADLLAALPGRNWKGIRMRAHRLRLHREVREGMGDLHRWQEAQDAEVIAEITVSQFGRRHRDIAGLTARLGLTRGQVQYRVRLLAETLGAGQ